MFKSLYIIKGPIHKGKIFAFNEGETAIVGPNGCGKSLLAEYMAFLLFGTVALRGKVADYKDLEVEGIVYIKGTKYIIHRSTKECTIKNEMESVICTGTKACNLKIITLLGYDYNVYKMGNYAEQLDILGLGKMKPSERKSALDKTLGIGVVDKLIKYTNDQALSYKHKIEGLSLAVREPRPEPSRPSNYTESQVLVKLYQEQQLRLGEWDVFTQMTKPEEPSKPIKPEGLEQWPNTFVLSEAVSERAVLEQKLSEFRSCPKPKYDSSEIHHWMGRWNLYNEYVRYLDKVKFLELDKEPIYKMEELNQFDKLNKDWENYNNQIKAYEMGQVTCPDCGHKFNPYKNKPVKPLEQPRLSLEEIDKERERIQKKARLAEIPAMEPVEKPPFEMDVLTVMNVEYLDYMDAQRNIPVFEEKLKELEGATPENLHRLQKYDTELELYNHLKHIYDENIDAYLEKATKFANFDEEVENNKLLELAKSYNDAISYERELTDYNREKAEYDRLSQQIEELAKQGAKYTQAVDKLKEMKLKIKGYVLPSLQKVASILLSEMSDGLFKNVKIDPEFNILVEDREVNLFSGSEQAMINLALRLGLGQVLTHKAFSVFIGDEIDASMRDERAQLTANCLRKISKYIKQVILISHRDIEADQYINLEGEK